MQNRVVVTGLGVVSPLGLGVQRVWSALLAGKSGITKITDTAFEGMPVRIAGQVPELNFKSHHPKSVQYALIAAREAMEQAGLEGDDNDMGVCLGSGMSGLDEAVANWELLRTKGPRRVSPHFIPRLLGNMAAGWVAMEWKLRGPNLSPATACASGAHAIGEGMRLIQRGEAKVMLVGATEAALTPLGMAGFAQARALATGFNENPEEASRPFDRRRQGFVMSEGAACLVLEEAEHAKGRGAVPLAECVGFGQSGDAYHATAAHPEGLGAVLAMQRALKDANVASEQVGYLNAHATSTPLGDVAELKAVGQLFKHSLTVTSTKGATGHLLGAAGALEALFTIMALKDGIVPPNVNLDDPDFPTGSGHLHLPTAQTPITNLEYAMSNSFGFGGTNASLLFKKSFM